MEAHALLRLRSAEMKCNSAFRETSKSGFEVRDTRETSRCHYAHDRRTKANLALAGIEVISGAPDAKFALDTPDGADLTGAEEAPSDALASAGASAASLHTNAYDE